MAKLKNILKEVFEDAPKVNKHKVIEGVSKYSSVGRKLYGENNLVNIAEELVNIAESAHSHILSETGDWFDKVTVNKNMKALKTQVKEFKVVANEANAVNQRLTSLYEDMGHILNRYYEISEGVDNIDDKEAATKFDDLKDKDIDNDGDTDDSDEYLHKKLGTVAKKTEAVGAVARGAARAAGKAVVKFRDKKKK